MTVRCQQIFNITVPWSTHRPIDSRLNKLQCNIFSLEFLAKQSSKLNSPTTITVPLQFIIILAGVLSLVFIIILLCFTGIILKHRKKRKLNRFVIYFQTILH